MFKKEEHFNCPCSLPKGFAEQVCRESNSWQFKNQWV